MQPTHSITWRKEQLVRQTHSGMEQISMQEFDSFGPSCATGGIEDIRAVERVARHFGIGRIELACYPRGVDDSKLSPGKLLSEPPMPIVREQDYRFGVLQHRPQSVLRKVTVERHIRLMCLK